MRSTVLFAPSRWINAHSTLAGSIAVVAITLAIALIGIISLHEAFSHSEETEYIAFAALAGNVGERLALLTTVNGERARFFASDCAELKDAVSVLGNQLPPSTSAEVTAKLHSATAATVAICRAKTHIRYEMTEARMRARIDRSYATAITIFAHDFLTRYPESHEQLESALFVGHPYLKVRVIAAAASR